MLLPYQAEECCVLSVIMHMHSTNPSLSGVDMLLQGQNYIKLKVKKVVILLLLPPKLCSLLRSSRLVCHVGNLAGNVVSVVPPDSFLPRFLSFHVRRMTKKTINVPTILSSSLKAAINHLDYVSLNV